MPKAKETRISLRIRSDQKAVIAKAARLDQTTITDFVVTHAFQAAKRMIADETRIEMTPEEFQHFCRMLDAPPAKSLRAMRKLLNEPSVLDG